MKKIVCVCAFLCALSLAFAQESAETQERETLLSEETKEALKEGGTRLILDMQSALQKAGETVDQKMRSVTSRACIGTWQFVNGKYSTTIKCLEDGGMEITQTGPVGCTTVWRGSYSSTLSQIDFTVNTKITSTMFTKKNEKLSELWIIKYSIPVENTIKLSSTFIPVDANGYDFSNQTLFKQVK